MRHNYVAIDHLSGKPFADAIRDDQHIKYWIWTGTRLVPASSEKEGRLLLREVLAQEELEITAERGRYRRRQRWQAF